MCSQLTSCADNAHYFVHIELLWLGQAHTQTLCLTLLASLLLSGAFHEPVGILLNAHMQPFVWHMMLLCSWVFLLLEFCALALRGWPEAIAMRLFVWLLPLCCQCMCALTRQTETHQRLQACVRWLLWQDVGFLLLVLPLLESARIYAAVMLCVVFLLLSAFSLWNRLRAAPRNQTPVSHVIV